MTQAYRWFWRCITLVVVGICLALPGWSQEQGQQPAIQPPADNQPAAQPPATNQPPAQPPAGNQPPAGQRPGPGPQGGRGGGRGGDGRMGPRARPTMPPLPGGPASGVSTVKPPAAGTPAANGKPTATANQTSSATESPFEVVQLENGKKALIVDFKSIDLDHFLRFLCNESKITIIRDPTLSDVKITIVAPDPVPLEDVFQMLNTILQSRMYTMTKVGPQLYKIDSLQNAYRDRSIPIFVGCNPDDVPQSSAIITQIIPLKNVSAQEVVGEIQGLLSQGQTPTVVQSTNSLIVTDTAGVIKRVLQLVDYIDVQQLSGGIQPIHLRYRDATEVASLVQSLVFSRGGTGGTVGRPLTWEQGVGRGGRMPGGVAQPQQINVASSGGEYVFPDTRTNTLFVQCTPVHFKQIQDLVEQLDKPISLVDSVYVYPAQNLLAADLANLVGPCVNAKVTVVEAGGTTGTGQGRQSATTGRNTANRRNTRGGSTINTGGYNNPWQNRSLDSNNLGAAAAPAADSSSAVEMEPLAAPSRDPLTIAQAEPGQTMVQPMPPIPYGDGGGPGDADIYSPTGIGTEATITANTTTNTLLIMAPQEQLELIKKVLEQVDVMPPQVYIQAVIAEVSLAKDNSLGFQWDKVTSQLTRNGELFTGIFNTNFGLTTEGGSGLNGIINGPNGFQAILNALATDTRARILSTPSIFTSNNEEALITVASQRPFPTSQIVVTSGNTNVVTGVDWLPVGIQLIVTPRVTQGNVVKLDVEVRADEPGAITRIGGQDYPTTNERSATAVLSVKDGNTVVLGGLMRETENVTSSKVPILGSIPIIGSLFRSKKTSKEKSELLVFLTPRVVRNEAEAQQVSEEERDRLSSIPRSLNRPLDQQGLEDQEAQRAKEKIEKPGEQPRMRE